MGIFMKICMAIGLFTLFIGGGGFILGLLGVIGAAGVGLFVVALPFIGIAMVIIFLIWLLYKFAVTLFKEKEKES